MCKLSFSPALSRNIRFSIFVTKTVFFIMGVSDYSIGPCFTSSAQIVILRELSFCGSRWQTSQRLSITASCDNLFTSHPKNKILENVFRNKQGNPLDMFCEQQPEQLLDIMQRNLVCLISHVHASNCITYHYICICHRHPPFSHPHS